MQHNPLPSDLVLAKPIDQKKYKPEVLARLEASGRLIGTRKRDGHKLLAEVCEGGKVRFYRSGMDEVDHRLDYLRQEIRELKLPPDTVLVGELVVLRGPKGTEDMGGVTTVLGGSFAKARVALAAGPLPTFVVFNAFHGSKLQAKPYEQTLPWLQKLLRHGAYVIPVEHLEGTLVEMQQQASSQGWEGLVLYEPDYVLTWVRGKKGEPRPKGCYKLKGISEDDFIVFARHRRFNDDGSLRDVRLLQRDPSRLNKLIHCARLGTFTAAVKAELAGDGWSLKVIQAKYLLRFPKTGKLREAAFMRLRIDKEPDNCIAPQSWPEPEYVD